MSKDLTRYATATATPTMEAFADFLIAEVFGGTLPEGIDVESFRRGVALGGSTRMDFQKSEAWKSDPRNYLANVETNRAAKAAERADRAKAAAAKAAERERVAIANLEAAVAAAKAKAEALAGIAEEGSEIAEEGSEEAAKVVSDFAANATEEELRAAIAFAEENADAPNADAPRRTEPRRSRRAA